MLKSNWFTINVFSYRLDAFLTKLFLVRYRIFKTNTTADD